MDALRSGHFEQCHGQLFAEDGKVCAAGAANRIGFPLQLDCDALTIFGMPRFVYGTILIMNDREKKTFPQIADFIEDWLNSQPIQKEIPYRPNLEICLAHLRPQ